MQKVLFNVIRFLILVGCFSGSTVSLKNKNLKYWKVLRRFQFYKLQSINKNDEMVNKNNDNTKTDDHSSRQTIPPKIYEKGKVPNLEDMVKSRGYPIEAFSVVTEDQYVLTLFRMKHGKQGQDYNGTIRKPVFLQHGILDSSAVYLAPPTGMAYYLADRGYDVWIGNARGTALSRSHLNKEKDPNKKGTTFWDFSFHEMGVFDLPAVLKKILEETGRNQRIHYIGMSMGSTQFLVMGSERPKLLAYIDCVVLMAPVAMPKHMAALRGVNYFLSWIFMHSWKKFTKGEMNFYKENISSAFYKFCQKESIKSKMCEALMKNLSKPKTGENLYDFENTLPAFLYSPAGTSVKCFLHYMQIASAGKFQKFNSGNDENVEEYNLRNINKNIFLFVGGADDIADEVDVLWLKRHLPSSEVIDQHFRAFTHRDFHHSVNIEDNLYNKILDIFHENESKGTESFDSFEDDFTFDSSGNS